MSARGAASLGRRRVRRRVDRRLVAVAAAAGVVTLVILGGRLISRPGASEAYGAHALRMPGLVAPWLHQRGTQFVTAKGRVVILRGINAGPSDSALYRHAVWLGANFVRVPVYWSDIERTPPVSGVHHYDRAALAALDRELGFLRSRGVEALIDLHQFHWSPYFTDASGHAAPRQAAGIPAWLYDGGPYPQTAAGRAQATAAFYDSPRATTDYRDFVSMMATRYRRFANVIGYEILNEPPMGTLPENHRTTQELIAWEAKIRTAITARDPLRTVFFMLRGAEDLGFEHADLRGLGSRRNLALDLHDYYSGDCGSGYTVNGEEQRCLQAKTYQAATYDGTLTAQMNHVKPVLARTRAWGIPLIVGEWGAPFTEGRLSAYQAQMLTVFARDGLSWARWSGPRGGKLSIFTQHGWLNAAGCQLVPAWRGRRRPTGCRRG